MPISTWLVSTLGPTDFANLKYRYQTLSNIVKSPKLDNYISFSVLLVRTNFNGYKSIIHPQVKDYFMLI